MDEKNRIIALISPCMIHMEEYFAIAEICGLAKTKAQRNALNYQKERYMHYAEQISESISHLKKTGDI